MKSLKNFQNFINEAATSSIDIPALIGLLFHSRDTAHIIHLATDSFAAHKALNEYYDAIVELSDRLAETYQGLKGKISISVQSSKNEDPISYFTNLHKSVQTARDSSEYDEISTIIDEILELVSQTLYKLKELS